MNGKELMLVIGAAVLGGGAAVAAFTLSKGAEPADPVVDTAAADKRMESVERSQARTAKSLERLSGTVDRLAQQVHQANVTASKANEAAEKAAAANSGNGSSGGHPGFAMHGGKSLEDLSPEERAAAEAEMAKMKKHLGSFGPGIRMVSGENLSEGLRDVLSGLEGNLLEGVGGEFAEAASGALGGMLKGFELRRLPEAERWQKAQDDLNLTSYQMEELKSANTALDEDMKGAMINESRDTANGGKLTIRRTDPAKALEARKRYDERVNNSLDTEQRKKWRDNGYSNAFGKSPAGGGISVMSVKTITNGSSTPTDGGEK
jgi:hypothetical protein